jgi:hypothetical protein
MVVLKVSTTAAARADRRAGGPRALNSRGRCRQFGRNDSNGSKITVQIFKERQLMAVNDSVE